MLLDSVLLYFIILDYNLLYIYKHKIKYLLSGAGITIAVIGILFGVFKLGEAKSRSTYIVQNKTNDKDEEDKK